MRIMSVKSKPLPPSLIGIEIVTILAFLVIMLMAGTPIEMIIFTLIFLISSVVTFYLIQRRNAVIDRRINELKEKVKVVGNELEIDGKRIKGKKVVISGKWVSSGNSRSYVTKVEEFKGEGYGYAIDKGGNGKIVGLLFVFEGLQALLLRRGEATFKETQVFMKHKDGDRAIISVSDSLIFDVQYYKRRGRKLKLFLKVDKLTFKVGEVQSGIERLEYPVNLDDDYLIIGKRITPLNFPLGPGVKGDVWDYSLKAVIDIPLGRDLVKEVKLERYA